ncbi:MAG: hypothetical protein PWQ93_1421 [Clostridiales bacterium]|jgi:hypothetical protein|nr:hypothetical protein [Clostridiales bacterium]
MIGFFFFLGIGMILGLIFVAIYFVITIVPLIIRGISQIGRAWAEAWREGEEEYMRDRFKKH